MILVNLNFLSARRMQNACVFVIAIESRFNRDCIATQSRLCRLAFSLRAIIDLHGHQEPGAHGAVMSLRTSSGPSGHGFPIPFLARNCARCGEENGMCARACDNLPGTTLWHLHSYELDRQAPRLFKEVISACVK